MEPNQAFQHKKDPREMVEWLIKCHGCGDVVLVEGDLKQLWWDACWDFVCVECEMDPPNWSLIGIKEKDDGAKQSIPKQETI